MKLNCYIIRLKTLWRCAYELWRNEFPIVSQSSGLQSIYMYLCICSIYIYINLRHRTWTKELLRAVGFSTLLLCSVHVFSVFL